MSKIKKLLTYLLGVTFAVVLAARVRDAWSKQ